jgi:hypothetical protein
MSGGTHTGGLQGDDLESRKQAIRELVTSVACWLDQIEISSITKFSVRANKLLEGVEDNISIDLSNHPERKKIEDNLGVKLKELQLLFDLLSRVSMDNEDIKNKEITVIGIKHIFDF